MTCYYPLTGYSRPSGGLTFKKAESNGNKLTVPCGQCIGCRLKRAREWSLRIMHEASLCEDTCFVTLTYSDDHLPQFGTLEKKDFQDFMKRLRKKYPSQNIRYFYCGEYGEKLSRPHYHACLFNVDFLDKDLHHVENGHPVYTSATLEKLWGKGICTVGSLTIDSAGYTARYILKKQTGENAHDHYAYVCPYTGEVRYDLSLQPEYCNMSLKPGIASEWFEKFKDDVYPHDAVIIKGREFKPPRFYDSRFEVESPKEFKKLKIQRLKAAKDNAQDNTAERLAVKHRVKQSQIKNLVRKLHDETQNL